MIHRIERKKPDPESPVSTDKKHPHRTW